MNTMNVNEECLKLMMEKYRTHHMAFLLHRSQRLQAMKQYLESMEELDKIASQIKIMTERAVVSEELRNEAQNLIFGPNC